MLPRTYADQDCSIAGSLEIIGDRWTLLVVREAFLGTRRFDDFQAALGAGRTVLSDRLGRLVEAGVLVRVAYQQRPKRHEYRLTSKGVDLWPVLVALLQWGDKYTMDGRRPIVLRHAGCGGEVDDRRFCNSCHAPLTAKDVRPDRHAFPDARPSPAP